MSRSSEKKYESIDEATEDVLQHLNDKTETNFIATNLATNEIQAWTKALSGLAPGATITPEAATRYPRILDVYENLEKDLMSFAEQHDIGTLNYASPAEVVFLAMGRELQSRIGETVNLNQIQLLTIRREDYELSGPSKTRSIEPQSEPPENAETIARQLEKAGQIVFYGPPGTGKTYTAQQFARWWLANQTEGKVHPNQLELTTFHPSFSYEDFIEGLTAKERDGAVEYTVESGVFKKICRRAKQAYFDHREEENPIPPYILIIDEINRGNLAQIFGELMTLIEIDKRLEAENETRSTLAHSNESFVVPPNLYLIGTMNTADQSIALLDAALRRRFRFQAFPPDLDTIAKYYDFPVGGAQAMVREGGSRRDQLLAASIVAIKELNSRIRNANQLGKGKQLGHTYLFSHETADDVRDAWRFDILPQLEDYYFGKFDRLQNELFQNTSVDLIDWEEERITEFSTPTLYQELCLLGGIEEYAQLTSTPSGTTDAYEDSWAAGEKTPEAFRERIERNHDGVLQDRIIHLWEHGKVIGELDPGRGDYNAAVTIDIPEFDPGVGIYELKDDGRFGFRWNWFLSRDDNGMTKEDVSALQPHLEEIGPYEIEWNSDEERYENEDMFNLEDLTEEEFENLEAAVNDIADYIRSEIVDAEG